MKKTIVVVLILATAYLAATGLTGLYFGRHIEALTQRSAAEENIQIHRLTYERGFFGGTLHYAIAFRPAGVEWMVPLLQDPAPALKEMAAGDTETPVSWIHLSGTADVLHGPFPGGTDMAMGRITADLPLPEQLNALLPAHPTLQPAIQTTTTIAFNGNSRTTFEGMPYTGPIHIQASDPTDPQLKLELQPWGGTIALNARGDRMDITLDIGNLAVTLTEDGEPLTLGLSGLHLETVHTKHSHRFWTGDGRCTTEEIFLRDEKAQENIKAMVVTTEHTFHENRFDSTLAIRTGPITTRDMQLSGFQCGLTIAEVDVAAYETLLRLIQEDQWIDYADPKDPVLSATAIDALQQLLAAGLSLTIDPLRFDVVSEADLTGGLELRHPPSGHVDLSSPETLLQQILFTGRLSASFPALQKIAIFHAHHLSSRQEADYGIPMSAEEIKQVADDTFSQMMIAIHFTPFFSVTEETVECRLEIKEGAIFADGEMLFHLRDLMLFI